MRNPILGQLETNFPRGLNEIIQFLFFQRNMCKKGQNLNISVNNVTNSNCYGKKKKHRSIRQTICQQALRSER